jgi:hypothetical protein
MKRVNLGFGSKTLTFKSGRNAMYSISPANKIKEVLYIGFDKEMELYHNNATVITKPLFILENLVFRDNGKFEMKNS